MRGKRREVTQRMGWERRKRGGLYYTRSRKVSGRVVREYVGGGLAGHLAAQMDDNERMDRKSRDEKRQAEIFQFESIAGGLGPMYG